ncbi:hypothetical protein D3C71_1426350 [compost metagenome]
MNRSEEHVIAGVEDVLRTVAMVVVDIEDRHFSVALVDEGLGGNGGVVQVAVATHDFGSGVMPGWSAQGKGRMGTLGNGGLGGQGHLGSAVGRLPGASGNGCASVEAVVAQFAVQAVRSYLAQGAGGPGEGQQVALLTERGPARPGTFEEVQVVGAVDPQQRGTAEVGRRLDRAEPAFVDLVEHMVGTRGHFKAGHQLAIDQLAAAVVQAVVIGIDRQHCCSPVGLAWVHCHGLISRGERRKRPKGDRYGQGLWPDGW